MMKYNTIAYNTYMKTIWNKNKLNGKKPQKKRKKETKKWHLVPVDQPGLKVGALGSELEPLLVLVGITNRD
jgi:hypothetical protein